MFGVIDLPTYLAGLALIVLLPGPNSLYVLSVAARRGVRSGYTAAAGVWCGDTVLMTLSAAGVASLLQGNAVLFGIVKYAGAGYLTWLAIGMLRAAWAMWRARRGGGHGTAPPRGPVLRAEPPGPETPREPPPGPRYADPGALPERARRGGLWGGRGGRGGRPPPPPAPVTSGPSAGPWSSACSIPRRSCSSSPSSCSSWIRGTPTRPCPSSCSAPSPSWPASSTSAR
ncbi:LysE family transporter [Streptomyces cadmiisoli]|uniref:LysE family transporter n=1 Tax=Streptomyces cadmiisoli TaxID=2184053 RepID=UPI003660235A